MKMLFFTTKVKGQSRDNVLQNRGKHERIG